MLHIQNGWISTAQILGIATDAPATDRKPANETINLRTTPEHKALIDRAAARLGKSRTEFMLDSAWRAATEAMLNQRLLLPDEATHARSAASREPRVTGRTVGCAKALLSTSTPWEC